MDIKPGVTPFDAIQGAAHSDSHGEGVVNDGDPLALSKDEFLQGFSEFGQHLDFDDQDMIQLWNILSNGKPSLSRDDFNLLDLKTISSEFSTRNQTIMREFANLMDTYLEE